MRYGSVCTGLGADALAFLPLGWDCAFVAEIEPFPCYVLHHRLGASRPRVMPDPETVRQDAVEAGWGAQKAERAYKQAVANIQLVARLPEHGRIPNAGDFTTIQEGDYGAIDLLVGGTPCQDFSIAGLGAGLSGRRGNLTLEFLELVARLRPRWLIWENVPNVLALHAGRAFGAFTGGVEKLGYGWASRILDAQHFDLAQRRPRVFVVGCLGDNPGAVAALFERQGLFRHRQARGAAPEDLAATLAGGARKRGGYSLDDIPAVGSLQASDGGADENDAEQGRLVATLDASYGRLHGVSHQDLNHGHSHLVTHTLRAQGFDASEDGAGRGTPLFVVADTLGTHPWPRSNSLGATVATTVPAQASRFVAYGGNRTAGPLEIATAVNAKGGSGRGDFETETLLVFSPGQITSPSNRSTVEPGQPSPALNLGHSHSNGVPVIAFTQKDHGQDAGEISPTLRAMPGQHRNGGGQAAVAFQARQDPHTSGDVAAPLDTDGFSQGVQSGATVRRFTVRECERLQGIPDDWTLVPYPGRLPRDAPEQREYLAASGYSPEDIERLIRTPDGLRYATVGNAFWPGIMDFIGRRIMAVERLRGRA